MHKYVIEEEEFIREFCWNLDFMSLRNNRKHIMLVRNGLTRYHNISLVSSHLESSVNHAMKVEAPHRECN
jgi:hypothetical protein